MQRRVVDFVLVGYFIPLNGPLNRHPPSYYYLHAVVIARKKAEEEYRRREDWRHKKEVLERRHQELPDTTSTHAGSSDTVSGDASWLNCHQTKQGSASQLSSEGTRESGKQFFLTSSPVGETGAGGGTTETKVYFLQTSF